MGISKKHKIYHVKSWYSKTKSMWLHGIVRMKKSNKYKMIWYMENNKPVVFSSQTDCIKKVSELNNKLP